MPEDQTSGEKNKSKEITTGLQDSLMETIHLGKDESAYVGETVDDSVAESTDQGSVIETLSEHEDSSTEEAGALPRQQIEKGICDKKTGQRFSLIRVLGQGGGGEVFQVEDHHLNRGVALKILNPTRKNSKKKAQRFIGEGRITARLEHPNILPVHDLGKTTDDRLYYTMRQATGPSLRDLIREMQDGDCPAIIEKIDDRVEISLRICDAIAYAHDKGVIHQDIKPDNIMLGSFGEVLMVDWGTAIERQNSQSVVGEMMGTPAYMGPAQALRESVDVLSDVYCLGVTMYQFFSGVLPLHTGDEQSYFEKKRRGEIDPHAGRGLG